MHCFWISQEVLSIETMGYVSCTRPRNYPFSLFLFFLVIFPVFPSTASSPVYHFLSYMLLPSSSFPLSMLITNITLMFTTGFITLSLLIIHSNTEEGLLRDEICDLPEKRDFVTQNKRNLDIDASD